MPQNTIPQIRGLPFLGNLGEFRTRRLDLLLRVSRECGDIGSFYVGPLPVVLLNSPTYIASVLVDQSHMFGKTPLLRRHLRSIVGDGLVVTEGAVHKQQRKRMAPAFQHRRVTTYAEVITTYAEELQSTWATNTVIDLRQQMMLLMLRVVGRTLFDVDIADEADELGEAVTQVAYVANDTANALVRAPQSWPTPRNRRLRVAQSRLDATIYRLIRERRSTGEDRGDLLSMLLHAYDADDGSRMSDTQVRDEALTLLIAGFETTATALIWTWTLLARHPAVYARVREEGEAVLAGRTPTADDLPQLPYTLQVLKEALRLYPPAWVILRQAQQPVSLGGYQLPQGMRVAISPYVLHRHPTYFPNADRFDPDRFEPLHEQQLPRYAYLPFGAGPHICIGNHFALMAAHLTLATLVQRVTFALASGQQIEPLPVVTLRPKDDIKMLVHRHTR